MYANTTQVLEIHRFVFRRAANPLGAVDLRLLIRYLSMRRKTDITTISVLIRISRIGVSLIFFSSVRVSRCGVVKTVTPIITPQALLNT